jgi:WD40 repeat protein
MPDLLNQLSDYARQLDDATPPLQSFVTPVTARPPRRVLTRPWVVLAGAAIGILILVGLPLLIADSWHDTPPAHAPTPTTVAPPTTTVTAPETAVPTTAVEVLTLEAPGGLDSAVAWSPDGTVLTTAVHGEVKVWDATTGRLIERQELDHIGGAQSLLWSPDGTRIAINSDGSQSGVYDATTGDLMLDELGDRALAWSPDGSRLVVGGAWGWSAVIDATAGDEELTLPFCPGPYSWVAAAAWSPDDTRIATTCQASVTIWDADSGDEMLTLTSDSEPPYAGDGVTEIEWSPDGTRIATAGDEQPTPAVWDADTGDRLLALIGHTGGVHAVAWSPDSTRLATASDDGTAVIWDGGSGDLLATLVGHTGVVTDIAWSPDGTRIATVSSDGTVKIWQVSATEQGGDGP